MLIDPPVKLPAENMTGVDLTRLKNIVTKALPARAQERENLITFALADLPEGWLPRIVDEVTWEGGKGDVALDLVLRSRKTVPVRGRNGLGYLVRGLVGSVDDVDERDWMNGLFFRYALEEVSRDRGLADNQWRGNAGGKTDREIIVGENTLQPVSFLESALAASKAIVHIDGPLGLGSGFLVADDLIMTCNHVIAEPTDLERTLVSFNYQFCPDGSLLPAINAVPKPDGAFHTNVVADLDYTVFSLDKEKSRVPEGVVPLRFRPVVAGAEQRVSIIQHPGGGPKMLSMRNNQVQYADVRLLQYTTSTRRGSSGSPVMNDQLEVLGVHNQGSDTLVEPSSGARFARNEGSASVSILADLKDNAPDIYARLSIAQ